MSAKILEFAIDAWNWPSNFGRGEKFDNDHAKNPEQWSNCDLKFQCQLKSLNLRSIPGIGLLILDGVKFYSDFNVQGRPVSFVGHFVNL